MLQDQAAAGPSREDVPAGGDCGRPVRGFGRALQLAPRSTVARWRSRTRTRSASSTASSWRCAPISPSRALQYGGIVWTTTYLKKYGLSAGDNKLAGLCACGFMILRALPVGRPTDVKGVGWVALVGSLMTALGGLPFFALLQ